MKYGLPLDVILRLLKQESNITYFEKENDIKCRGIELLEDYGDIKFYSVKKTDNTNTLTIIFRTGKNTDTWIMWRITDNQASILNNKFPQIYEKVNQTNNSLRMF